MTNNVPTMADFEIAWTNLDRPSKKFVGPCNGWRRIHPTQKPLGLIMWCFEFLPDGGVVLDGFFGSGTTAIAAEKLNRKWIGIEISEEICEGAARRIESEAKQLKMFP